MTRTRLAKLLFHLSEHLARVQTPRRIYRVTGFHPFRTEFAGRRWLPCRLSTKVLRWSMHLDEEHWDHWALAHERCDPQPCATCGGCFCEDEGG